jgi:hypothetical protein
MFCQIATAVLVMAAILALAIALSPKAMHLFGIALIARACALEQARITYRRCLSCEKVHLAKQYLPRGRKEIEERI